MTKDTYTFEQSRVSIDDTVFDADVVIDQKHIPVKAKKFGVDFNVGEGSALLKPGMENIQFEVEVNTESLNRLFGKPTYDITLIPVKKNWFRRFISKIKKFKRKSPSQLLSFGIGGNAKEMETQEDGTILIKSFEVHEFSIVEMPGEGSE